MPELPEVEAFKWYVKKHCLNKVIAQITCSDSRVIQGISLPAFKKDLRGNKFTHAERLGKYIVITLSSSNAKLVFHFALTGSFEFVKKNSEKIRFSVVSFIFTDRSVLHFKSVRKFEKIWLVADVDSIKGIARLGPDALKVSGSEFIKIAASKKNKNVKSFLMDQKIIAGIGNEYVDEILFQSKIDPHHSLKDLSSAKFKIIYKEMRTVLSYARKLRINEIKKAGSPFLSQPDRETFNQSYLQAHRHFDMVCPRNKKHKLKKTVIAGRSTYYCPEDQT